MGLRTIETADLAEIEGIMRERYAASIDVASGTARLRLTTGDVGPVELTRIDYSMDATTAVTEPVAHTCIARVRRGRLRVRSGRAEEVWTAGDVFVAAVVGSMPRSTVSDCDVEFAVLDPALLSTVARTAGGTPVTLTGSRPFSAAHARTWVSAFEFARDLSATCDPPGLVSAQPTRLLAAAAVSAFPSTADGDPTAADRRDARPTTVRLTVAFIQAHPDRDLGVVGIARAAHVSPRALQLAFRRHLDTTPMAYLRRVRLDCAHRDLLAGTPADSTVVLVATRWGFADPSRFARVYRATYGRPPHVTLGE